MRKSNQNTLPIEDKTAAENGTKDNATMKRNGNSALVADIRSADLSMILGSLHAVRDGDFSVRPDIASRKSVRSIS